MHRPTGPDWPKTEGLFAGAAPSPHSGGSKILWSDFVEKVLAAHWITGKGSAGYKSKALRTGLRLARLFQSARTRPPRLLIPHRLRLARLFQSARTANAVGNTPNQLRLARLFQSARTDLTAQTRSGWLRLARLFQSART